MTVKPVNCIARRKRRFAHVSGELALQDAMRYGDRGNEGSRIVLPQPASMRRRYYFFVE
jgi:hypothetical protein